MLLTAMSMKERSQTVGMDKTGKRLIEGGVMRIRKVPNNGEELLTVPGMYYVPGTMLSALHTHLTHLSQNTMG